MKYIVCSIYDNATEAYMRPFVAQSRGQAVRMFTDLAQDNGSEIAKHPEDYKLFQIGEFFDSTGNIESCEPDCLARAWECLKFDELKTNMEGN